MTHAVPSVLPGRPRRLWLRRFSATLLSLAWAPWALAAWPNQALTLVVGFSKGSSSEVVASTLAEPLSQRLGKPVQVEVVTGKAGTAAAAKVAAATDGHTFGIVVNNALTVAAAMDPDLGYNPDKDLRPLAFLTEDALVLVGAAGEPSATASDFLLAARNAGAQWKYGSQGAGSIGHLGMEYLGVKSNLHPTHVPMVGGPEVAQAIKEGKLQLALLPPVLAKKMSAPGQGLKMVAVTTRDPYPALPGVPTLHQSGVLGFDFRVWTAAVAPKGWSAEQQDRLSKEIQAVLADAEVVKKLAAAGLTVAKDTSAAQARREVAQETKLLGGIVMLRGLKAEAAKP